MPTELRLTVPGYRSLPAAEADRADFIRIKMACYRSYVEQFYGPWNEADQIRRNGALFDSSLDDSVLHKILLHDETVGFWGYRIDPDAIRSFHLQFLPCARGQGLGSSILEYMADLSVREEKPVLLKVFRTNPARNLYRRFGFRVCDETPSHFIMRLDVPTARRRNSPDLVQKQIGPALVACDPAATRAFYAAGLRPITCTCTDCRNFIKAARQLPPEVLHFLAQFGVDPLQPAELSALCTTADGTLVYDGFWHICGRLLNGDRAAFSLPSQSRITAFFTDDYALAHDDFPRPILQLHLCFDLPWLLQEENTYEKE